MHGAVDPLLTIDAPRREARPSQETAGTEMRQTGGMGTERVPVRGTLSPRSCALNLPPAEAHAEAIGSRGGDERRRTGGW
jgi:hypothetical protein